MCVFSPSWPILLLSITFGISEEAWYLIFFFLAQVLIKLERTESKQVEKQSIVFVTGKDAFAWLISAIKWAAWFWALELKRFPGPSCPRTQAQERWTRAYGPAHKGRPGRRRSTVETMRPVVQLPFNGTACSFFHIHQSGNYKWECGIRDSSVSITVPPSENKCEGKMFSSSPNAPHLGNDFHQLLWASVWWLKDFSDQVDHKPGPVRDWRGGCVCR